MAEQRDVTLRATGVTLHVTLLTQEELQTLRSEKGSDAASQYVETIYLNNQFDWAKDVRRIDTMEKLLGEKVYSYHFVTLYPRYEIFGQIVPITLEGWEILERLKGEAY